MLLLSLINVVMVTFCGRSKLITRIVMYAIKESEIPMIIYMRIPFSTSPGDNGID